MDSITNFQYTRAEGDELIVENLINEETERLSAAQQVGLSKVFWGAAEFVHLADIINQTDGVEGFDGEEKLGQPMLRLSLFLDRGTVNAFILPWFRERTFPGKKDRLRTPLVIRLVP